MGTDGKSTSAATSKPAFDSSREAGIAGSMQRTSSKMNPPLLLNQPSADSFAQIESGSKSKNNKNLNAGNYEWDADENQKDIEDDDTKVPIPLNSNMLGMAEGAGFQQQPSEQSRRPLTSHGRGRKQMVNRPGVQKREEIHSGLGETSKDGWAADGDADLSTK